jgi:hypothetical protein
MSSNNQQPE